MRECWGHPMSGAFFCNKVAKGRQTRTMKKLAVDRVNLERNLAMQGPMLDALIIASPLPDEFGVSLLGLSKVRVAVLLPIAFVMNFLGILAVAGVASVL